MRKLSIVIFIIGLLMIICDLCLLATPSGKNVLRFYESKKMSNTTVDVAYRNQVEDTCENLISLYEYDKYLYLSLNNDMFTFGEYICKENARERANRTADIYNEYVSSNKYVWGENLPSHIYQYLEKIED